MRVSVCKDAGVGVHVCENEGEREIERERKRERERERGKTSTKDGEMNNKWMQREIGFEFDQVNDKQGQLGRLCQFYRVV